MRPQPFEENKMRYFVTGCAGFIGSSLTDRLLADGHSVVGYDNLSTGREIFLARACEHAAFRLVRGDILDGAALGAAMRDSDAVFHLAANADVRFGAERPGIDLEQNTVGTHRVLEAMRTNGVRRIAFASSGSVYGEAALIPTPEDAPFPIQTSLYGASKCAAEGLLAAYSAAYGLQAHIFRFVSILGERYTHGHVFDFMKQLRADPRSLRVLGDGRQRKSYLYVGDCVDAMLLAVAHAREPVSILNLGTDEYCELSASIAWICTALGAAPAVEYAGGERGWIGDNPFLYLDTRKIRALGWQPRLSIREAVERTVRYLSAHPELLDSRP
jgi:UDP-glucose 4-epimerase